MTCSLGSVRSNPHQLPPGLDGFPCRGARAGVQLSSPFGTWHPFLPLEEALAAHSSQLSHPQELF